MFIFGVSSHAKAIHDLARAAGVTVIGFIDQGSHVKEFAGLQVLSADEALSHPAGEVAFASTNPETRRTLFAKFAAHGWRSRTLIHPRATVAESAKLEAGCCIFAGAVVQAGAELGAGTMVSANAVIDHDAKLSAFTHVAPGAVVGSEASVGEGTWIGANASVLETVKVGAWAMVGAGAIVAEDLPGEVVAYGVPARVHRQGRYFAPEVAASAPQPAAPAASSVRDTVADVINTILRDTGREARTFANQDVLMGNIGLDSLDLAVMTVSLEQRTGLDPFRSGRGAVRSFGELVSVYEESIAGSGK